FSPTRSPPLSPLFPYTTLFRSDRGDHHVARTDFDAVAGPDAFLEVLGLLREAVLGGGFREELGELRLHLADLDAVLRALGAGERGRHAGEVELDHLAVVDRTLLHGAV